MFAESERARAMRMIRERDTAFDMVRFLFSVRADIPEVLKAYLTGNSDVLEKHCSKEMVERLSGDEMLQTARGTSPLLTSAAPSSLSPSSSPLPHSIRLNVVAVEDF